MAYVFYPDEGHGFRRAENVIATAQAALAFLGSVHGFAPADVPDAIRTYRAHFVPQGMWMNSVFAGIPEVLGALQASGRRLAVATSKPQVYARQLTERFGLDPFLEGVFGATLEEAVAGVPADGPVRSSKADAMIR